LILFVADLTRDTISNNIPPREKCPSPTAMTNINDQIRLIFEGKKSLGNQEHAELYKLTVSADGETLMQLTVAGPSQIVHASKPRRSDPGKHCR